MVWVTLIALAIYDWAGDCFSLFEISIRLWWYHLFSTNEELICFNKIGINYERRAEWNETKLNTRNPIAELKFYLWHICPIQIHVHVKLGDLLYKSCSTFPNISIETSNLHNNELSSSNFKNLKLIIDYKSKTEYCMKSIKLLWAWNTVKQLRCTLHNISCENPINTCTWENIIICINKYFPCQDN